MSGLAPGSAGAGTQGVSRGASCPTGPRAARASWAASEHPTTPCKRRTATAQRRSTTMMHWIFLMITGQFCLLLAVIALLVDLNKIIIIGQGGLFLLITL